MDGALSREGAAVEWGGCRGSAGGVSRMRGGRADEGAGCPLPPAHRLFSLSSLQTILVVSILMAPTSPSPPLRVVPLGTTSDAGSAIYNKCPAGTYRDANSDGCLPCAVGSYAPTYGEGATLLGPGITGMYGFRTRVYGKGGSGSAAG